jgi:hypothetical protein
LATIRKLATRFEPAWVPKSLVVNPLLVDHRLSDFFLSLALAFTAAMLGIGFLFIRGLGGWRYRVLLGARVFMAVMALALLRWAMIGNQVYWKPTSSIFGFWIFLMACVAMALLLVIDHRSRCPVCLRRLKKPVPIGVWSSQILDQPATEYLCPAGHGTLYVAETGNAPAHWTLFDESWHDLFIHTDS